MIKKVDHIAIAVKDIDEEIKRYRDVMGLKFLGTEVVEEQKVKVAFFEIGDIMIELTCPTSDDSPISKFIEKKGGGIHHIAYETDNVIEQIADFEKKGVIMLNKEPKKGAHNAKIAFAHPKSFAGVLVELKEKA